MITCLGAKSQMMLVPVRTATRGVAPGRRAPNRRHARRSKRRGPADGIAAHGEIVPKGRSPGGGAEDDGVSHGVEITLLQRIAWARSAARRGAAGGAAPGGDDRYGGPERSLAGRGRSLLSDQPTLPLVEGTAQMSARYHETTPITGLQLSGFRAVAADPRGHRDALLRVDPFCLRELCF